MSDYAQDSARVTVLVNDLDVIRGRIMDLHGGNLDHPALDHIEKAMNLLVDVDRGGRPRPVGSPALEEK